MPYTAGVGVLIGENVRFGKNVKIWNYTVIQNNCVIGDNVTIGSFCDIGRKVLIGNNTIIQAHVTISNECKIGNDVFIGPNTTLLNDRYPRSNKLRPVVICDKVIISGGVVIMPDVVVGTRAFVAGAAVVTRDVSAETAVKTPGLPARPFMDRDEFERKRIKYEAGPNRPRQVTPK
jgi:UDP-2-acetamido-3-amino-2,3-dideoxy-glucuronate N-acetyltransferase